MYLLCIRRCPHIPTRLLVDQLVGSHFCIRKFLRQRRSFVFQGKLDCTVFHCPRIPSYSSTRSFPLCSYTWRFRRNCGSHRRIHLYRNKSFLFHDSRLYTRSDKALHRQTYLDLCNLRCWNTCYPLNIHSCRRRQHLQRMRSLLLFRERKDTRNKKIEIKKSF